MKAYSSTVGEQLTLSINQIAQKAYYNALSPYPYVSDNISEDGLWRTKKSNAVKYPLIQHNNEYKIAYLAFDIDINKVSIPYANSITLFEDVGSPPPNFIMINPTNGHSHYLYVLAAPVLLGSNARTNPRNLMLKVERGLCALLQADIGYSGLISKNPLCDKWQTYTPHNDSYTLEELAEYVDMTLPVPRKRELGGLGRNCDLFDNLRYWAYLRVTLAKETGNFERWFNTCLAQCEKMNTFNSSLSFAEVKSIAKSVSKWTWTKYTGSSKRRGRDTKLIEQWQGELTLRDIQALSAHQTNKQRVAATTSKIQIAIKRINDTGDKITQAKVSQLSGIHKDVISRSYRGLFL